MERIRMCAIALCLLTIFMGCKTPPPVAKPKQPEVTKIEKPAPAENVVKPAVRNDSAFTVISFDRNKRTLYRGLKNPITIVVPNAITTKVEGNGVMKIGNYGHYNLRPGNGDLAELKITATMPDGSTFTETRTFAVKNLPNPKSYLAGVKSHSTTVLLLTEDQLKQAEIALMMEDVNYDLELAVTGFDVVFPSGKKIKVDGNKLSEKAIELLKKVRNNGIIKIQNITASSFEQNASFFKPEPIVVKLIKTNKKARPKR